MEFAGYFQCLGCRHFVLEETGYECPGFPEGIPDAILDDQHDHKQEYPGDNGYRFTPKTTGA